MSSSRGHLLTTAAPDDPVSALLEESPDRRRISGRARASKRLQDGISGAVSGQRARVRLRRVVDEERAGTRTGGGGPRRLGRLQGALQHSAAPVDVVTTVGRRRHLARARRHPHEYAAHLRRPRRSGKPRSFPSRSKRTHPYTHTGCYFVHRQLYARYFAYVLRMNDIRYPKLALLCPRPRRTRH